MIFQVEWQELIYDNFNNLIKVSDKPLFEVQAISLDYARETAENRATRLAITRVRLDKSNDLHVAKVIALIDENNVRYQLKER